MGRESRYPGLRLKGDTFWIDINSKKYGRIYESTGCGKEYKELAQAFYLKRTRKALEDRIFGVRPTRTFREAAAKHLVEETGRLKSVSVDAWALEHWAVPSIGDLALDRVHDGTLEGMKKAMAGRKQKTINLVLQVVRKILNKAARKWRDESGKTWLETAPLISIDAPTDARPPYPLSWEEERKVFLPELPGHLQKMAMFALNVGPRDEEICSLRWAWERRIPELDADYKVSVFVLPDSKNGTPRLLVLNKVAMSIVESCRGNHPEYVFSFRPAIKDGLGEPRRILTMNNSAWRKARLRASGRYKEELGMDAPAGFQDLHVHDLRHTFGRRLRAAGVSSEDRADLLGHVDGNMTTHYSAGEVGQLLQAVRKLEGSIASTPTLLRIQAA